MEELKQDDILQEAITIVERDVTNYKDGEFFITENVAIAMRPLIRLLRKNYWGVFDQPRDPVSNREKYWVPLTRLVVDTIRKHVDIDLKDINFRAVHPLGRGITDLVRGFVRRWLEKRHFGQDIDVDTTSLCIDGTFVWKTYTTKVKGKTIVHRKTVDLLNCYIDPTAESIQKAYSFTERALLSVSDIEGMTGWTNTDNLQTSGNLHRSESDIRQPQDIGEYRDTYEYWGKIPKRLVTKRKGDTELIDGHIVLSGIEVGDRRVHLIEENTNKDKDGNVIKPYEEAWFLKVQGRWFGVGPAEAVLRLQEWVNTIVNLRISKNTNASLGLFKIKSGSGVTQQMLSNLVSKGVIKLNNMDDLENLQIAEAGESSYRDEDVAKSWAFNVTSTHDIARGESLPASTTATTAVLEDRNTRTAYALVIESLGHFLNRWMDRHFLPHVPKLIKESDAISIFGDIDNINEIRERVVSYLAIQQLDELFNQGIVPTPEEVQAAINAAEGRLRSDKDLFFDTVTDILTEHIDTVARFTNEETDVAVTVKSLTDMAGLVEDPQARNSFLMEAMDLLGLRVPESLRNPQPAPQAQAGAPADFGMPSDTTPTEQRVTTAANTPSFV